MHVMVSTTPFESLAKTAQLIVVKKLKKAFFLGRNEGLDHIVTPDL